MKLSIVIPAHNEEASLRQCLASIFEEINRAGLTGQVEVAVVNNASTDRTEEIAASFPGVKIIRESRKGLTFARQAGLLGTTGDILANVDADTRMPPGWIDRLLKEYERRPNMVCLSGPYRYYDLAGWPKFFMNSIWWLFAPLFYRLIGFMVLGGNFAAKRSALLAIGGFDTSIGFYGEDTNLAKRISKQGKAVFLMPFFIYTSGRRLVEEGLIRTNLVYGMNFLWEALFQKPFTKTHNNIRQ